MNLRAPEPLKLSEDITKRLSEYIIFIENKNSRISKKGLENVDYSVDHKAKNLLNGALCRNISDRVSSEIPEKYNITKTDAKVLYAEAFDVLANIHGEQYVKNFSSRIKCCAYIYTNMFLNHERSEKVSKNYKPITQDLSTNKTRLIKYSINISH